MCEGEKKGGERKGFARRQCKVTAIVSQHCPSKLGITARLLSFANDTLRNYLDFTRFHARESLGIMSHSLHSVCDGAWSPSDIRRASRSRVSHGGRAKSLQTFISIAQVNLESQHVC